MRVSLDFVASLLSPTYAGLKAFWMRWSLAFVGVIVFLAVVLAGSAVLDIETSRIKAQRKVELMSLGSLLQARLSRELAGVLLPTVGLNSYLVARGGNLNRREMEAILQSLYGDVRHIRNFGVAVGYRLRYLYPIKGNEKVVGLDYRSVPDQWRSVKRVIDGGVPILLGPQQLIQGGRGLVYRVPVLIRGKYWGLISTVIDADSLLADALRDTPENIELAVRGRDGRGTRGGTFWGDPELFQRSGVELIDVTVPGGNWVVGMQGKSAGLDGRGLWPLRILVWVLALFLGWGAYALLAQRARLARLAMFDTLTGLPNRSLIEDRMNRAISAQRRNPSTVSALLFVDLDGFKRVNDRYGHRAGDAVLQGVAARAARAVRDVDSVGRWGGDELVVVLEGADRQKIPELIKRVRLAVEAPLDYAGQSLRVGASIGSAIVPDDGESASELIRFADRRMYDDKRKKKRPGA